MNDITNIKDYPYVYRHLSDKGCMGDAFYLSYRPEKYSIVKSKGVVKIDGTKPSPTDPIECGNCGGSLSLKTSFIFNRGVEM